MNFSVSLTYLFGKLIPAVKALITQLYDVETDRRRNEIRWIKLIQAEFELTIKTMLSEEGFQKRRL